MEATTINTRKLKESIHINFFSAPNPVSSVILIGGSGDTKDSLSPLAEALHSKQKNKNIYTFSFTGVEKNLSPTLKQQTEDLENVLNYIMKKNNTPIILICTSMGAYSAVNVMLSKTYLGHISHVIFLDPADYYIKDESREKGANTWAGFMDYNPTHETASFLLKQIKGNLKIDVIHLPLRNHGPDGYAQNREIDNPQFYPRLNSKMAKSFYENVPVSNRGKYLEIRDIPHAFARDGNLNENVVVLTNFLNSLLNS